MERYRSGHNGADSKAAHNRHFNLSAKPWNTSLFRDFKCRVFRGRSTVFYQNSKPKFNTERYRSGHNGADSKSVCAQAHEGSNPSLSANAKHTARCAFCVGGERGSIMNTFCFAKQSKRGFAFEPKAVWELAHKRIGEKFSRRRVPLSAIF